MPYPQSIPEWKSYLIRNKEVESDMLAQSILPLLNSLLNDNASIEHRICCSDTFGIWLTRATKKTESKEIRTSAKNEGFRLEEGTIISVFHFIVEYMDLSSGAMENSLSKLLCKLVGYTRFHYSEDSDSILKQFVDLCVSLPSVLRKQYILMETLFKETKSELKYGDYTDYLEQCIINMKITPLANSISKAFFMITSKRHERGKYIEWLDLWESFVLKGLEDEETSENIQKYMLPLLFGREPLSYLIFMQRHFSSTQDKSVKRVDLYLGLLGIGKRLDLRKDNLPFLAAKDLSPFLCHEDTKIRLKAFSILTSSTKGSEVVEGIVFEVLKDSLYGFFVEATTVEYRNELASMLCHFIKRVKDSAQTSWSRISRKSKSSEGILIKATELYLADTKSFFEWLLAFLKKNLLPGNRYPQMILSLRITELLESAILPSYILEEEKGLERSSNRPKNQYYFHLDLFSPKLVSVLVDNLRNNYEEIQNLCSKLLLKAPANKLEWCILSKEDIIWLNAREILGHLKGKKCESGSISILFLAEAYYKLDQLDSFRSIIDSLLGDLERFLGIESIKRAHTEPKKRIHGVCNALTSIISNNSIIQYNESDYWKHVCHTVYVCVNSIWDALKPQFEKSSEGVYEDNELCKVRSTYYWKLAKESSALLSSALERICQFSNDEVDAKILKNSAFLFIDQLASIKHRGAFSSINPCFVTACECCYKMEKRDMRLEPSSWLDNNIRLIQSKSQLISRRSGGFPFLVSGILKAGIKHDPHYQSNLERTLEKLLNIMKTVHINKGEEKMDLPQVHAFNCLKQILSDSDLAEGCSNYYLEILNIVLENFGNPTWSIRNCAVMVFSILQNRMFGTNKMNEDDPKFSSKVFFSKYRGLKEILLDKLKKGTSSDNGQLSNIFPILTILIRLETIFDGDDSMKNYEHPLKLCMAHKVWKIREMGAKSLANTLAPNRLIDMVYYLLEESIRTSDDYNKIHGNLVAVLHILSRIHLDLPSSRSNKVDCGQVYSYLQHFWRDEKIFSLTALKAFLDIIDFVQDNFEGMLMTDVVNILKCIFVKTLQNNVQLNGREKLVASSIQGILLKHHLNAKSFEEFIEIVQLSFSSSKSSEVQLSALKFLSSNLKYQDLLRTHSGILKELQDEIWMLLDDLETWDYVKSMALSAMKVIEGSVCGLADADVLMTKIKLLISLSETSKELLYKLLEILGALLAKAKPSDYTDTQDARFFSQCNSLLDITESNHIRAEAVRALVAYLSSMPNKNEALNKVKYIYKLYKVLDDTSETNRKVSAFCLSNIITGAQCSSPYFLKRYITTTFFEQVDKSELCDLCAGHFLRMQETILTRVEQIRMADTNTLFDLEAENSYKNDLTIMRDVCKLLSIVGNEGLITENSLLSLKRAVNESLFLINRLIEDKNMDGPIGWCREEFPFITIMQAIEGAFALLNLERNNYTLDLLRQTKCLAHKNDLHQEIINLLDCI